MKDFPVFTTENGVASLVFKEVPYRGEAYITIRDSISPEKLLEDCLGFCKAVGAQKVYAGGHAYLEKFPLHTHVYEMTVSIDRIPDTDAALFPVTQETLEAFRCFYNDKMITVSSASYMTSVDAKAVLEKKSAYFVHRQGSFLGIAIGSGERLDAIAVNESGAGEQLVRAIRHALTGERITLEVASANERAVRLYERMGFIKTRHVSSWYKIFEDVK